MIVARPVQRANDFLAPVVGAGVVERAGCCGLPRTPVGWCVFDARKWQIGAEREAGFDPAFAVGERYIAAGQALQLANQGRFARVGQHPDEKLGGGAHARGFLRTAGVLAAAAFCSRLARLLCAAIAR